tara:strand:+ start:157 stop:651 length:495 start_codon:yes stop_codon:yes gene_type:complete
MKTLIINFLLATSTLFISCGSSETKTEKPVNNVKPETEKVWEEFTIEALGNTMMDMQYSVKNISVNAGSWVRINLINKGVDPAMIHNILIVNYNKRSEVATAALEAGQELDYIPKSKDVIAGSKQANPGETVTLEFKAPSKGNYEFFCSYPGHSSKMRGYFFVK